jgi:dTDP-4-dehydrorhamnose reductase
MYTNNILKRRILIVGVNGMLGQRAAEFFNNNDSVRLLACSIEKASLISHLEYTPCDITDREAIKKIIYDFCPDFILNAAAFTNVDASETQRELAWKVNVKGVEYLAEASRVIDAHVIHISSDYIFDGKNGPYDESSKPCPIGYYGRTKLASENALKISGAFFTIIRTNVLFGLAANGRPDFVKWVVTSIRNKQLNSISLYFHQLKPAN